MKHDQNFFAVSFVAMDFINGENSKYSYKLENFSNVWMDTRSNEAQFTNIPPGNYILRVKYDDGSSSNENLTQSIYITILPPWYWSIAAQTIYVLLLIGAGLGLFRYIRWKYERRKASIDRRLKENIKKKCMKGSYVSSPILHMNSVLRSHLSTDHAKGYSIMNIVMTL